MMSNSHWNWSAPLTAEFDAEMEKALRADLPIHQNRVKEVVRCVRNLLESQVREMAQSLAQHRFWWIGPTGQPKVMVYDKDCKLLWEASPDCSKIRTHDEARFDAETRLISGLAGWRLPSNAELKEFASASGNPLRSGDNHRLLGKDRWWTAQSRIDLDFFQLAAPSSSMACPAIVCNDFLGDVDAEGLLRTAVERQWGVSASNSSTAKSLLADLRAPNLKDALRDIDHFQVRLPRLEAAQFDDPHKGLWELWGFQASWLRAHGLRARDPAMDVRDWNVAIDFGTSSTVVAYDDNDRFKLLRVGVADYWEREQPAHYENPTVLELLDIRALLQAWHERAYRPGVEWDHHARCSHAALQNFRDSKSNPRVVASLLTKLKHWALREAQEPRWRLMDRTDPVGIEHELAPLTQREPVKGQPLVVEADDAFDPIELYAWFLGMTINWRGRGLFLRYYMTFPVAYPRQVKDKILSSFRRGLQRSLPAALVGQPVFQRFSVQELASEPAAYAACAVASMGIEPTAEGAAYAVFDFGGGTTDFDFGLYRQPNAQEENTGTEQVFEQFGAAGDRFLGGENLLENLSYLTFRHNLELCRTSRIAFTRPPDAEDFAGSEMFLEQTQAARTNTVMLMERLRPLWEGGSLGSSGMETIDLVDRDGAKKSCQLAIPVDLLTAYLGQRIEQGVYHFLAALKSAFRGRALEHVHVMLAGNASRSRWLRACFGLHDGGDGAMAERVHHHAEALFDGRPPTLTVHEPLAGDIADPYRPTAKTGVALGLLRLCPGGPVKIVNRTLEESGDEAPFAHHVGCIRRGLLQVGLPQGSAYGQWHELGVSSEGVFNLYHTQSPQADMGTLPQGAAGLFKRRLEFPTTAAGSRVFARALGPSTIELRTAASLEAMQQEDFDSPTLVLLES